MSGEVCSTQSHSKKPLRARDAEMEAVNVAGWSMFSPLGQELD